MVTLNPCVYDNCKNCVSKCEHAGKGREFVCIGGKSCKVVYSPDRMQKAAADFVSAVRTLAEKPENLDNLECYLSAHFQEWLSKFANTPDTMAAEMKAFAEMVI